MSLCDLDALLPSGVARMPGPATKPPDDFHEGYVLPEHSVKPLQVLNTHPHDKRLIFYEKPHVYTVDGVPTSCSVTGLAHAFDTPFDPDKGVEMMKTSRSQSWPRLEYVVDATIVTPEDDSLHPTNRGALLVCDGKTLASVQPHSFATPATRAQLWLLLQASKIKGSTGDVDAEVYTFEREMTAEEIKAGWARNGKLASNLGTEGHWLCELFLNGLPCRWWEGEMKVLFDFAREYLVPRGIVGFSTEKEILYPKADLAGSIDLILYEPSTGLHHILDYKRSAKLKVQMRGYGKMKHPFTHLDDSKGAAYALQTSIYQFVLEKEYGMTIGERILLSIDPDVPFATSVPYLKQEVEYIFRQRELLVAARKDVADADSTFRCALCDAPVVDAVRLSDGRVVMEKMAQIRELEGYEVATDVREAFEARVNAKVATVDFDPKACVTWKRQMPDGGIRPFGKK